MKAILLSISTLVLIICNISAFADKITVTGEPIILEQSGDTFTAPATIKPNDSGYYYVKIGEKVNACYLTTQPALVKLTPENIVVKVQDEKVTWSCYPLDPTYFVMPAK